MPNLKSIKRKILSIKNTRQITKAMKMVAGAKLKKAVLSMNEFKPYFDTYKQVILNIANNAILFKHPYFKKPEGSYNIGYIIISTDRGLCGSFNVNIFKKFHEEIKGKNINNYNHIKLYIVGKKGVDFFKKHNFHIEHNSILMSKRTEKLFIKELADKVSQEFISGGIGELYIISNLYVSTLTQKANCQKMLPFEGDQELKNSGGYLIEPVSYEDEVIDNIFKDYIIAEINAKILESEAGEQASRMNAMENATRNAGKMINRLTLSYNKARQAAVTLEILDIVNGANSLK